MRNKGNTPVPGERSKVRFVMVDFEGSSGDLQQLAQTFANAVKPHSIMLTAPAATIAALPAAAVAAVNGVAAETVDESTPEEAVFVETEQRTVAPKPSNGVKRKARAYTVVADLNLRPEGKKSLVDFYREKAPGNQEEQITVFLYYMSRTLNVSGITDRHIYTCYKAVDERVPPEILQVARNTANRKGWVDASDGKNLRLTVNGENHVEHSLPKSKSNAK